MFPGKCNLTVLHVARRAVEIERGVEGTITTK